MSMFFRQIVRCGCGKPAKYEVYADAQPHCKECHDEATSGKTPVLVRKVG